MTHIIWFRNDLRLIDNPAVFYGAQKGEILPLYIQDESQNIGKASAIALHYALEKLQQNLQGHLAIVKGSPLEVLPKIIKEYKICSIHCNLCLEPEILKQDQKLKQNLPIEMHIHNSSFLFKPWEVFKHDGSPYKIFTSFYKTILPQIDWLRPSYEKTNLSFCHHNLPYSIKKLDLLPQHDWYHKLSSRWKRGEDEALNLLDKFYNSYLKNYEQARDKLDENGTSLLSSYLHWGEISPYQILEKMKDHPHSQAFIRQLIWREFAHYTLFHFPHMVYGNLRPVFDDYPWDETSSLFLSWKKGQTGYPLIDAAMMELYETGFMHNRARMIVASFLVKNLNIHWRQGMQYFHNHLIDASLANNAMGWQWIAGSGIDASPYFRIFNPITQGKKFDPKGQYIKKYLPQLATIPKQYIHEIWKTPKDILKKAYINLGENYPHPIVSLPETRKQALSYYYHLSRRKFINKRNKKT